MDSSTSSSSTLNDVVSVPNGKESMVDPFLVEALQNPRHRLTILRMELDIQRFLQSPDQHQFEFQHFPTSYLRLAAHRAAQHYGLQTMVQDGGLDGQGSRILVKKTSESRYPPVRLCEISAKQLETDGPENVKIVIRPRPNKSSSNQGNEIGVNRNMFRSVEERKEEYDKARARIFSGPNSPESDNSFSQTSADGKPLGASRDENESRRNSMNDLEKTLYVGDISSSSRVAILRDREKDRTDPDYDRSYNRYTRSLPTNQSFNVAHFNMQKMQPPFVRYDPVFSQLGQMPRAQTAISYGPPSSAIMNPFCAMGVTPSASDAAYMQWSAAAMMYAHTYEQSRHNGFQAPFCQQPLSFDYSQNH